MFRKSWGRGKDGTKKGIRQKRPRKDKDGRETLSALKDDVWAIFSRFIRTRGCLQSTGTLYQGKCVTCGRVYDFKKLQAGHFIDGRTNSILFDETGCHPQCHGCNMFKSGAKLEYREWMVKNYGEDTVTRLMVQSRSTRVFTRDELLTLRECFLFQLESLNPTDELVLKYQKKAAL